MQIQVSLYRISLVIALLVCVVLTPPVTAESLEQADAQHQPTLTPQLPAPFRDNAVLQRGMALPVWGQSLPGAAVTVTFDGQSKTAHADAQGQWRLVLEPLQAVPLKSVNNAPAGKTMAVVSEKDGKRAATEIKNLLVGDVWLCAGQSNIAGSMRRAIHPKNYPADSIPKADYPALRLHHAAAGQPALQQGRHAGRAVYDERV